MRVLAIDTATTLCGVAIGEVDGAAAPDLGRTVMRRLESSTHSEMLMPLIAELLAELGIGPRDLSAVVCGAGPGSFTGLRIGIATAKGLCFALGVPLVMVSSLEALAEAARERSARPVLATLNAFRGQAFARLLLPAGYLPTPRLQALLAAHPELCTDAAWNPATLAALVAPCASELVVCGGGLVSYPVLRLAGAEVLGDDDPAPHPLAVLRLGLQRLQAGQIEPLAAAAPNYICVSAAEENAAAAQRVAAGGS